MGRALDPTAGRRVVPVQPAPAIGAVLDDPRRGAVRRDQPPPGHPLGVQRRARRSRGLAPRPLGGTLRTQRRHEPAVGLRPGPRRPSTLARFHEHVSHERATYAASLSGERAATFARIKVEGIRESGLGVVVGYDPLRGGAQVLGRHAIADAGLYSVVCAIQNLWLAATAEGLGVGWVSFYREEFLRSLVGMPEHVRPVAWLCVGASRGCPRCRTSSGTAGATARRWPTWFTRDATASRSALPRPLGDGAGRRPAGERPDRAGRLHRDPDELAAVARVRAPPAPARSPGSPRAPPAGRRARARARQVSSTPASVAPPPTKIASGARSDPSASGARPCDHVEARYAESSRVAGDPLRALGVGLDRGRRAGRMAPHPLDPDGPGPGSDVPQVLAGRRGEPGERRRAQVALGELAVVLEGLVRQPRRPAHRLAARPGRAPARGAVRRRSERPPASPRRRWRAGTRRPRRGRASTVIVLAP